MDSATADRFNPAVDRRGLLRAGATAIAAGAGLAGSGGRRSAIVDAQSEVDYGDWFADVDNYTGTVDRRGQDEVVVEVGVEANGGPFGYGPAALMVSPGTTVRFEWVSDTHNLVVDDQPTDAGWSGSEGAPNATYDTGYSEMQTFDTTGIYRYFCQPHLGVGMKGAIVVRKGAPAVGEPDYQGWFDDVDNYDETVDRRGDESVTVSVGSEANGGPYGFGPAAVRVSPGTTVQFSWVSDNHNVVVEDQPAEADWAGSEGGPDTIYNTGHTFEHTFDTRGVYRYYCQPHLSLGMKGAIVVGDVGGPPETSDGPASDRDGQGTERGGGGALPGGPVGSLLVTFGVGLGVVAVLAALSPEIGNALNRGSQSTKRILLREYSPATVFDAPIRETERTIDHDQFDPRGTVGLIVLYFLILVGMWVFTYFAEFLGNGPTIIG